LPRRCSVISPCWQASVSGVYGTISQKKIGPGIKQSVMVYCDDLIEVLEPWARVQPTPIPVL